MQTTATDTTAALSETPEPTGIITKNETAKSETKTEKPKRLYGKNTNTDKTFTGLEPLPTVTFNFKSESTLSNEEYNHSFGVSKDGKPHDISVNNQKFYEKYGGMCLDTSGEKVIYLTFDCGYENGVTPKILDTLKAKKVPAAFFVTMDYLKSAPEIAARMIKEGHTIGNHSDTHANFSKISREQMVKEVENVENYLRTKFGYSSSYFRFPEGACSENSLELVQSIGYTSVFWSSAYADWDTSVIKGADYAFDTVASRLHPGCILLLHAVSQDNADALGRIIDYARENGYTFKELP